MKKFLSLFLILGFLALIGCSDDATAPTNGGGLGGGGNGGGGGVTFTIGQRTGDQGGIMFTAKPSTAVTVTQFTVNLPAQQFSDPYQGDGTTVFQAGQVYDIAEYTGVTAGQQWTFNFKGKIGSSTGTDYDVTSNYTVQ